MNDYATEKRRAWLRDLQSRQAQDAELSTGEMIKEFLGALAVFAIPLLMLFIGTMAGL